MAFVWELTQETINLPLGCLQGGSEFPQPGVQFGSAAFTHTRRSQLLRKNVMHFRGGLVFTTHRLVYHPTLGSRVIKKKETRRGPECDALCACFEACVSQGVGSNVEGVRSEVEVQTGFRGQVDGVQCRKVGR